MEMQFGPWDAMVVILLTLRNEPTMEPCRVGVFSAACFVSCGDDYNSVLFSLVVNLALQCISQITG